MSLSLAVHGCRGSSPVAGASATRYGGNTTCIEIGGAPGHHLLLDAGTGLRRLQAVLPAGPAEFSVLLTHYHWDHIQGLPFFRPLFTPGNRFTFYGFSSAGLGVAAALRGAIRPPWFPVGIDDALAEVRFVDLTDDPFEVAGVEVRTARLSHPQGVTAYRFDRDGSSAVVATDHESGADPAADRRLAQLAGGCDVLAHDAQYLDDEYPAHAGWGHSTWSAAVAVAAEAGATTLLGVSHDPARTDDAIDGIVAGFSGLGMVVAAGTEGVRLAATDQPVM